MPADARTKLRINPFFDGEVKPAPTNGAAVPGPVVGGYHDVDRDPTVLTNGRPMASGMRPGPRGLRGTVIPHATPGGIPVGTRPHETGDLQVNYDADIPGQAVRLRLGDVAAADFSAAQQLAVDSTPEPVDAESQRFRNSAVIHAIAAVVPASGGRPVQAQPQSVVPSATVGPQRVTRPLSAFNQAPPQVELLTPFAAVAPAAAVAPPQIRVTFEIENFGTNPGFYHDVLVHDGFIVLVYRRGYEYGEPYFPQQESPGAMALHVAGTDKVYLVHATGVVYTYDDADFCLLMVEKVAPVLVEAGG